MEKTFDSKTIEQNSVSNSGTFTNSAALTQNTLHFANNSIFLF
mgnify:CR=1 FL=1